MESKPELKIEQSIEEKKESSQEESKEVNEAVPFKSLLREFVTLKPFEQEPKGLRTVQRIDQHGYQKKLPE